MSNKRIRLKNRDSNLMLSISYQVLNIIKLRKGGLHRQDLQQINRNRDKTLLNLAGNLNLTTI
jgi:hypothetical protein